jgi:hypothetical protein
MKRKYHLKEITYSMFSSIFSDEPLFGGYLVTSPEAISHGERIEFRCLSGAYEFETKGDAKNVRNTLYNDRNILTDIQKF